MSGEHLDEMSSVRVWCPASLQTFDTLFVPQQMSQMRMCFLCRVVQCCSFPWPHGHSRVCEAHWSSRTRLRPLHSTRSCKSSWHPLPRVGWVQRETASLAMPPFIKNMGAMLQKLFAPSAPPLVEIDTTGACSSECCEEIEVVSSSSSSSKPHTHASAHESYNTIPPDIKNVCESGTYAVGLKVSQTSGGMPGMKL